MGLETGTGIGDLVPTNPLSTDAVSSGDDHIRLIKTVMQSITFLKNIVTFTASGTWTRPANVKKIIVYCLGSGAGGHAGTAGRYAGGGGGGGGVGIKWLDVSAISSATVTIGAGGTNGATPGAFGSNGNDTSFVTSGPVTQCLGKGGLVSTLGYNEGGAAVAASLSIGDIQFPGNPGAAGATFAPGSGEFFLGGAGGGGGGGGSSSPVAPANGGGGGAGGVMNLSSILPGGTGGSGYCIILEFGW